MRLFFNFFGFQVGWFACVYGAANTRPLLGPLVVLIIVTIHLAISKNTYKELILLTVVGLIGLFWDSLLMIFGLVTYPSGVIFSGLAPYWVVSMWVLYATTLNVCLHWLRKRYFLSIFLGALLGPLAYFIGEKLGGINILNHRYSLFFIGVGWAMILPMLNVVSKRLDGAIFAENSTFLND